MNTFYFDIADATLRLQLDDTLEWARLIPSFRPFQNTAPATACLLQVKAIRQDEDSPVRGELISSYGCGVGLHHFYRTSSGYTLELCAADGHRAGILRSDKAFSQHTLTLTSPDTRLQAYALSNALLSAYTFAAVRHHILIVHASVIVWHDRGWLFLGPSGTGKSTHANLWLQHIAGSSLLNDDTAAVRRTETGEVRVYGTPWSGKTPCYINRHYPVQAFVRIRQHKVNAIRQEDPIHAFSSLFGATSQLGWNDGLQECNLQEIEQIVRDKPVYLLQCLPDRAAAELNFRTTTVSLCPTLSSSPCPS